VPNPAFEASAWISTSIGRVPSISAVTAEPDAPVLRPARNAAAGFATGSSPDPVIRKTPISSTEPNRFFTARRIR